MTKPGDRVIVHRNDGTVAVFRITTSGERVTEHQSLPSRERAYEEAIKSLPSGCDVWGCDEATPDEVRRNPQVIEIYLGADECST